MRNRNRFKQIVYIVTNDLQIESHVYADLCRKYASHVCSPRGRERQFFLRGTSVCRWFRFGIITFSKHETQEDAEYALLECYEYDLENGDDDNPTAFFNREKAEMLLNTIKEELSG